MINRITKPMPTKPNSPAHAPPDMLYAPGLGMARKLGWFSIGLGLAELLAPRRVAELTGFRNEGLLRAFGVREIVTGLGILSSQRPTEWMWARVAGDALDAATLLAASTNGDRGRTLASIAAVGGVAALDAMCATQLSAAAALEETRSTTP